MHITRQVSLIPGHHEHRTANDIMMTSHESMLHLNVNVADTTSTSSGSGEEGTPNKNNNRRGSRSRGGVGAPEEEGGGGGGGGFGGRLGGMSSRMKNLLGGAASLGLAVGAAMLRRGKAGRGDGKGSPGKGSPSSSPGSRMARFNRNGNVTFVGRPYQG